MAFFSKKKNKEQAHASTVGPISPTQTAPPAGILQQAGPMPQPQQQQQPQQNMFPVSAVQNGPSTFSGFDGPSPMHQMHPNMQQPHQPQYMQAGPPMQQQQQGGPSQMYGSSMPMSNGVVASASPTPYNQPGQQQQQQQYSPQQSNYPSSGMAGPPRQFAHSQSGSESSMNPSRQGPPLQAIPGPGPQSQGSSGLNNHAPASTPVSYPWSQRPIRLQGIQPVPSSQQSNPASQEPSPSPFPRYGHSVNPFAQSSTGDLYLFGGLVKDLVKNDLYMITCSAPGLNGASPADSKALAGAPMSISMVETRGEIPSPRVGHTSVSVGNVLIVWGGDTKTREEDPQDDNLYLLNLGSRDWTLVKVTGPAPQGRYGHAAAIRASKFYIFGGQQDVPAGAPDDAAFLNDLWCFDLQNLKAGKPQWTQIEYAPGAIAPPKRTGHTMVTQGDCLYIFGGTDGQYHYNDTWCFSTSTGVWTEMSCIGYIPVPREGHASTLVDDVVYVFGGRSVDGKDLEDLAAFKISNQRWYMFTNMGPAPSGRSGHAMATWQNKVFVLGGESYVPTKNEYPNMVHMLDTGKIKYPSDSRKDQSASRKTSNPKLAPGNAGAPPQGQLANKPMQNLVENEQRRAASPTGSERDASQMNGLKNSGNKANGPLSQSQQSVNSSPGRGTASPGPGQNGPRRPSDVGRRAMSPINEQPSIDGHSRALSPTMGQRGLASNLASTVTPPTRTQATMNGTASTSPPANVNISALRANARSPSPVQQQQPQLSRSMDAQGSQDTYFPSTSSSAPQPRQTDEIARLRSRERWMQAALAAAVAKGFVLPDQQEDMGVQRSGSNGQLVDMLLAVKAEVTSLRSNMAEEARQAEQRLLSANKSRSAAVQEAAFYRSKIAALEANSTGDLVKLERGRISELEKRIAELGSGKSSLERRLEEMESELDHHRSAAQSAIEREAASIERAEASEGSYSRSLTDYAELQRRAHTHESSMQEYLGKIATLESQLQQLNAQHGHASSKLETAASSLDQHLRALEQTQTTLTAANTRASEMESLWMKSRDDLEQHQEKSMQLAADLQATDSQLQSSRARIDDLERALKVTQDEAQSQRQLTSNHLTELLSSSRNNNSRSLDDGNAEQLQALQEEAERHRVLAREAHNRATNAQTEMREAKLGHITLEKQIALLRGELAGLRTRHASALEASSRAQALLTQRDMDLREKSRTIEASEVRSGLLKNLLAENGLSSDDNGSPSLRSSDGSSGMGRKIAELESRLEQRSQAQSELQSLHDQARQEAESSRHRLRTSEEQINQLNRQVEDLKLSSSGAASRDGGSGQAEQELAALQEKHQQLETTHLKAVQYVKGTEKMFRRMKDELTKYKERNEALEAEVASKASKGSHSRNMSTELRPELDSLRSQLAELRTQSEQATSQNEDLQEHIKTLQSEYDKTLANHQTSSSSKVTEYEAEIDHLQEELDKANRELEATLSLNKQLNTELSSALKGGNSETSSREPWSDTKQRLEKDLTAAMNRAEWLKRENASLEDRCRESENKVSLLLDHIESSGGVEAVASSAGHSTDHDHRDFDKWKGVNGEARSDEGSDYSASLDSFQQRQQSHQQNGR